MTTRREFLSKVVQAGGMALAAGQALAAQVVRQSATAPLPRPKFYWGVGIENCWIAQTDPRKDGNRRLLDVYQQMQHYDKWRADLDLAKQMGLNAIRYSVPWYKAEPSPGVYDWSWIDGPIEYLVEKLKIIPMMDLIHYGTPAWMADGVIDDRFPEAIGRYAEAMAAHFKGLVNHYSPHNEPGLTCLMCGRWERWPPYHKTIESWAKIGVRVAKGMVLAAEAIRRVLSDAVIVSVDPLFYEENQRILAMSRHSGEDAKKFRQAVAAFPASLAYGKATAQHPFAAFLKNYKISDAEMSWFTGRTQPPDIVGFNRYPIVAGKTPAEVQRSAEKAAEDVKKSLIDAQAYFQLPIYLTETSSGDTDEAKVAYIEALGKMVAELGRQQFPLVGVNWWPLYETIQWDYRENPDRPLTSFIVPGGWNNGLYKIAPQANGDLKRAPTRAVEAYKKLICGQ